MKNKRVRQMLGTDVLTEAKNRLKYIFSNYDDVVVSFSGGKDSLVLIELADEVRVELGIEKKLSVVFFDEEVIQSDIVDFVKEVMDSGRFNFRWLCVPLHSERFLLGKKKHYVQWDVSRKWVRPMPEWAEDLTHLPVTDETKISDRYLRKDYKNSIFLTGIRAEESNTRRNAVMKGNMRLPFLVDGQFPSGRPIYDWSQNDIFKYIQEKGISYCKVYDRQVWGKAPYRVATPFNNAAAKHLDKVKEYDPEFYDQLLRAFPDTDIQARYYKEYDKLSVMQKYGITPEGIIAWAKDILEGNDKMKCMKTLNKIFQSREKDYRTLREMAAETNLEAKINSGKYTESEVWIYKRKMVRFPLYWVFYRCIIGSYKKSIDLCTDADIEEDTIKYEELYNDFKKNNKYEFE